VIRTTAAIESFDRALGSTKQLLLATPASFNHPTRSVGALTYLIAAELDRTARRASSARPGA
jgi:hypothetical protein